MAPHHSQSGTDQSLLAIVFDAEALGREWGPLRAWQMWMERLDPREVRGAAFYDGSMTYAGNRQVFLLAISGSPHVIAYVRDAFAAPDLSAFPGIAPIAHRFIEGTDLPRERLTLRGFMNAQGEIVARPDAAFLPDVARRAEWPVALAPKSRPVVAAPTPKSDMEQEETHTLRATRLEGATQVMLRLWKPSFSPTARLDRRRRLVLATAGMFLILGSLIFLAYRLAAKASEGMLPGATTPTQTAAPTDPLMVVAPLELRVPCSPGQMVQFTISNNGGGPLVWSSDAAEYSPPLALNVLKGSVPVGESQVIQVTTSEYVTDQQQVTVNLISNGGQTHITLTIGGCQAPTATPTIAPTANPTATATP